MAPVLVTLKVIPVLQAFSSAIRRTFVQYFTRFPLTARSRGPSATAGLLVFIAEVALLWEKDYCDAVRQPTVQSSGGETRLSSSVRWAVHFRRRRHPSRPAQRSRRSYTVHTARPSTFFFTWPSTCFRCLPFICGRWRSTRRTTCRIGRAWLLICCRCLAARRAAWQLSQVSCLHQWSCSEEGLSQENWLRLVLWLRSWQPLVD